ncbi:unnamed protein product [Protopolystoma xenopodis]|uniref:Uncharacterized protein n=1 Tax=Protopolystoma xenopodis TaxID=117903 RepID=A0A3S5CDT1_9PLAT|nr:unnamed protein product [Protopolystoma xenopodis]
MLIFLWYFPSFLTALSKAEVLEISRNMTGYNELHGELAPSFTSYLETGSAHDSLIQRHAGQASSGFLALRVCFHQTPFM